MEGFNCLRPPRPQRACVTVRGERIRLISARSATNMEDVNTKKTRSRRGASEMRPEYDFSEGTRGKCADGYRRGTNLILLDPELTKAFPDSKAVNDALRTLLGKRV